MPIPKKIKPKNKLITDAEVKAAIFKIRWLCLTDRSRAQIAQTRLIISLEHLVKGELKSYLKYFEYDELYNEGLCQLCKAIGNFDPTSSASFFTYAKKWILFGFVRFYNRYGPPREEYTDAYDDHLFTDETPESILLEREATAERSKAVNKMNLLSEKERTVVCALLDGKSYDELAPYMGVSVNAVRNICFRARKKLGEHGWRRASKGRK